MTDEDGLRWLREEQRSRPPRHEVASALALGPATARTDTLGVALLGAHVHSNGVLLELAARLRRVGAGPASSFLPDARGPLTEQGEDDLLIVRVTFADGRTVVDNKTKHGENLPDETPLLRLIRRSSTPRTRDETYWLTPLPPPGDLTLTVEWRYRSLPDLEVVVPGEHITEARARVVELWPYEPEPLDW